MDTYVCLLLVYLLRYEILKSGLCPTHIVYAFFKILNLGLLYFIFLV